MDIRLAVKEYIQNQIDQVLRETHVQYWSDWEREDLRDSTEEQCLARKRDLMKMYPGLLSGAQGTKLRHGAWLPMYILRGNTSLDICVIMWKHKLNISGLSFYNNHLDSSARFIHFVVDGATTDNTGRPDIAGRGTGFIRASQFLLEEIDRNVMQLKTRSIDSQKGLSFRIGHLVGELQWFKHPDLAKDQARVKWEDLTPPSLHGILASQVADQKDKSQQLKDQLHESRAANIYYRRFEQNLAVKTASTKPTEPYHETSLVTPDEVLITVIGLSGALTPGYVFSGIFGLVPPRQIWRISGRTPQSPQIHFYKPEKSSHAIERMLKHGRAEFYHRGQLILSGSPLNKLGINYVGNLSVTPDRMTVIMSGPLFNEYKAHLSAAVDLAFRTMPDLAVELAIDILADHGKNSGTIGRVLRPVDTEGRDAYRAAFNEAFKTLNPDLGQSNVPYPFCEEGQDLIREFGMVGYPVLGHVQMILQSSGAFPGIKVHAESLLLEAALYTHEVPGSGRMRRALAGLLPGVTEDQLSIRNFKYSFPTIIWDEDRKIFAMGVPAVCEDHANDSCVCWLGPYLADAVASWEKGHLFNVKEKPSKAAMYRAYIRSMQGVVDMREPPKIENTVVTDGRKMPPYIVGEGGENVLGYSTLTPGGFELDQTTFRVPEASVSTSLHPKSYSSTPTSRPSGSLAPEAGSVLPSKDTANEALQLDRHKIASGDVILKATEEDMNMFNLDDVLRDMKDRIQTRLMTGVRKERMVAREKLHGLVLEVKRLEDTITCQTRENVHLAETLEAKGLDVLERDLSLMRKDEMMRQKDTRIGQLKQSMKAHSKRVKKLEASVRRLEGRERERSHKLHAELDDLKKRLSMGFVDNAEDEDNDDNDDDDDEHEDGPPRKKLRST